MRALVLFVALILGGTVSAQQARYSYIDQPAPYSNPSTPLLVALNTPKVGTVFRLQVPYARDCPFGFPPPYSGRIDYYVLTGVSNPSAALPGLGYVFSSGELVLPTPYRLGGGSHVLQIPIPNSASLVGVPFFQQVVEWGLCRKFGYRVPFQALSRGGHGVIGM